MHCTGVQDAFRGFVVPPWDAWRTRLVRARVLPVDGVAKCLCSNRSTSSCHCAAVRRARCFVPRVRVMISFASASWGAASESDGTPDH